MRKKPSAAVLLRRHSVSLASALLLSIGSLALVGCGQTGTRASAELRQAIPVAGTAGLAFQPFASLLMPGRDRYAETTDNPIRQVSSDPVSTFSIDVDTGSYTNVRRFLNAGALPPTDAVRIEEMINYFRYADADLKAWPAHNRHPFAVTTELGPSPWNANRHLLRVALNSEPVAQSERANANLVFLIDVSGSMAAPNKLPLLKRSLAMLSNELGANDRVSMVVYAGRSAVILPPTPGNQRAAIRSALEELEAAGSTNGSGALAMAYEQAASAFVPGGVNRVLLATDGDFNVGVTDQRELLDMIERQRKKGIALTTLGLGSGNYNDHLMEQLADHGNGNHAYIDQLSEARKVLVDELGATLQTVASDVKIQIEFNPAQVSEYRLIGYQNRALKREDFNNDAVDAGEIGAGHSVVALYEIRLRGAPGQAVDPLRYATKTEASPVVSGDALDRELAYVKLRYKPVAGQRGHRDRQSASVLMSQAISVDEIRTSLADTSSDFQFAAAVAAFGQKLRGGRYLHDYSYQAIHELAVDGKGADRAGYRGEFLGLVRSAAGLAGERVEINRELAAR